MHESLQGATFHIEHVIPLSNRPVRDIKVRSAKRQVKVAPRGARP
jgi:hypothetical protein